MGLGDGGWRTGARLSSALWLGNRAEWPHSPDPAESGGQRHFLHGAIDRLPDTRGWHRASARAGRKRYGGSTARSDWRARREVRGGEQPAGGHRHRNGPEQWLTISMTPRPP